MKKKAGRTAVMNLRYGTRRAALDPIYPDTHLLRRTGQWRTVRTSVVCRPEGSQQLVPQRIMAEVHRLIDEE